TTRGSSPMTTTSRDVPGTREDQGRPPPPTGSRQRRRHRRPPGGAPPLPRHLAATGVGWLVVAIALIALSLLVFTAGRYGQGVALTLVGQWLVERLTALRTPGLVQVMLAVS